MPPRHAQEAGVESRKRKGPPPHPSRIDAIPNKRPKMERRLQQRDIRTLAAQTSSKALKNGELDVDKFVKAREFEIRALEEGMSRSRKAQNLRAFQQVPKELRRRTASHNVKRVPKRLQRRARREMMVDNTPTVTARRRKPSSHQRLRLDTAKKLRALGAKRKLAKEKAKEGAVTAIPLDGQHTSLTDKSKGLTGKVTRAPKVRNVQLAEKPTPKAKFRKRQFDKTWLPTHVFHAKRAHMTPPKQPLWGFALPLTPTVKSYRPTHRAVHERGAVAWDTSHTSTIGLEGQQRSLEAVLKALRFDHRAGSVTAMSRDVENWKAGIRAVESLVYEREFPNRPLAPVTVLWAVPYASKPGITELDRRRRKLFLRVHASAFAQLWGEVTRLVKIIKPQPSVEDLRYEIGSLEISGPSATEALLSALRPTRSTTSQEPRVEASVEEMWTSLAGLTNLSMLPRGAMLGFDIQDPRLYFPPRCNKSPSTDSQQTDLLETLAVWPADQTQAAQRIFDRLARVSASSALPSQKSINRRKGLAHPGQYPSASPQDPKIPLLLYSVTSSPYSHDKWVVLLPWKCVLPVWYSIMYYPLTSGGQPRFGGVQEQRQLAFEAGVPWFPADFPATEAGWRWEQEEREKREKTWRRLPKSKRISWDNVDLGQGKKGEIGLGWACDWHALCRVHEQGQGGKTNAEPPVLEGVQSAQDTTRAGPTAVDRTAFLKQIAPDQARQHLQLSGLKPGTEGTIEDIGRCLASVRIDIVDRGVPQACARIYRLPRSGALRTSWLGLRKSRQLKHSQRRAEKQMMQTATDAPPHVIQRRLAQSILEPPRVGDGRYPPCPGEEDLIGFVTTGNFNLGEGRATGVGCILLERVTEEVRKDGDKGRMCVVRNAGSGIGRLAKWCLV